MTVIIIDHNTVVQLKKIAYFSRYCSCAGVETVTIVMWVKNYGLPQRVTII